MDLIRASGKLFVDKEFPPSWKSIGDFTVSKPIEPPVYWYRAKVLIRISKVSIIKLRLSLDV